DDPFISSIKSGGRELEEGMKYLYLRHSCREMVFRFIQKRNGSREDAEDIFQDGIRFLILQVRAEKYHFSGELGAYLYGICKNLWYKRFKKMSREEALDERIYEEKQEEGDPELYLVSKDRQEKIKELMAGLGAACQKVLQMWQLSYSMKEIAVEMGYKNDAVARKKKRLCMKKLLDTLEKVPVWKSWIARN
ncbi:MAG: sigma-70 family RNA polymerase sigma factor, partial [Bacteroidota bacterium]